MTTNTLQQHRQTKTWVSLLFNGAWQAAWNYKKTTAIVVLALVVLRKKLAAKKPKETPPQTLYFDEKRHARDPALLAKLAGAQSFYESVGERGTFRARDEGVDIAYVKFVHPNNRRVVVLLTGWSESIVKYAELVHELYTHHDMSVYLMDHRGQGLSGRQVPNTQMTFVSSFDHHVNDVEQFMDQVVAQDQGASPVVLFGFSLGGLVASRFALRHPERVQKLVLVCPCLLPFLDGLPPQVVTMLTTFMSWIGNAQEYVTGAADAPDHRLNMPPLNVVSHSIERIKHWEDLRGQEPVLVVNGMSNAHVREVIGARVLPHEASSIAMPTLLISAEHDKFVDNLWHDMFEEQMGNRCQRVFAKGSLHEVLQEVDEIREPVVTEITAFMLSEKQ